MSRHGEVGTVRRSRNTHETDDSTGPLRLEDAEADLMRLRWYVRSITVGPEDGYGLPYAHVRDRGKPSAYGSSPSVYAAGQRFAVTIGAGARALGFEEQRTAWFTTLHAATDAAVVFAQQCDTLKRARESHLTAEREAREALFPSPKDKAVAVPACPEPATSDPDAKIDPSDPEPATVADR